MRGKGKEGEGGSEKNIEKREQQFLLHFLKMLF